MRTKCSSARIGRVCVGGEGFELVFLFQCLFVATKGVQWEILGFQGVFLIVEGGTGVFKFY